MPINKTDNLVVTNNNKRLADIRDSDMAGVVRKDAVSPDTIIGPLDDCNTDIRVRKEQISAVDNVISSTGFVGTPQECKRLKIVVENDVHTLHGNQFYRYPNTIHAPMAYNYNPTSTPYYHSYGVHPYGATYVSPSDYLYHIHCHPGYHPSSHHEVHGVLPQNPSLGDKVDQKHPNRKESSLGALCQKFFDKYENFTCENNESLSCANKISIDSLSIEWQVGRRRIYDIINILEAIDVVSRKCKNTYQWYGLQDIENTFRRLQIEAVENFPDYAARYDLVSSIDVAALHKSMNEIISQKPTKSHTFTSPINGLELLLASAEKMQEMPADCTNCTDSDKIPTLKQGKRNIKENSLSVLSKRFVQMFLLGNDLVELSSTSALLVDRMDRSNGKDNSATVKTTVRRMYDIANVIAVLGFVEKVSSNTNKAAFRWSYNKSVKELWAMKQHSDHFY